MIAKLPYNPRVILAPGNAALAAEIQSFVGQSPDVGDWFLKLEGLNPSEASALSWQAIRHGGGALVKEHSRGVADVLLRAPADNLETCLGAVEVEEGYRSLAGAIRDTVRAWQASTFLLDCRGRPLRVGPRTLLMGIVNVTPDSFSDGGQFLDPAAAIEHGRRLVAEGVDILDIGGESTRPGAEGVDGETECSRVLPVIQALSKEVDVPISIDTSKAEVARRALDAGASMINDVTALRGDPSMAVVAAASGAPVVLMHMQGTPRTMQEHPHYDDLMSEVVAYLRGSLAIAVDAGIPEEQLVVDPGLGFGKTLQHNVELLRRLGELRSLGRPILVGPSRKSMIGKVLGLPPQERLLGTAATVAFAIACGAHIVRVHDVAAMRQVARMTDAILGRVGEGGGVLEASASLAAGEREASS